MTMNQMNQERIIRKNPFSEKEDERLSALVQRIGTNNWEIIAKLMPNRNIRQVRERWLNYLNPYLKHSPWTPEEDRILVKSVQKYGTKWQIITKNLHNRSQISARNRYLQLSHQKINFAENINRISDPHLVVEKPENKLNSGEVLYFNFI
jgi:hypothetical protein